LQFTQDWAVSFRDNMRCVPRLAEIRDVDYLELGVFEGRSAVHMLQERLINGGSYTGVDICVQDVARANVEAAAKVPVSLRCGNTWQVLPELLKSGQRFDLVYVDASHTYPDVLHDSMFAWRLTKPGGVVLWGDMICNAVEPALEPLGAVGLAVRDFMGSLGFKLTDGLFLNWQFAIQKPLDCVTC
jgi:predicted O-methyltransferase YrrM